MKNNQMKELIINTTRAMLVGALSFGVVGNALADLNNGLIAYYPFNGNADDESGNNHNGTVNGASLIEDRFGNPNSSYEFNGVSDYIELPTNLNLIEGNFSFSAWIKPNSYGEQSSVSPSCASTILSYRYHAHNNGSTLNSGSHFFLRRDNNCTGENQLGSAFIDSQNQYNTHSEVSTSDGWLLYSVVRNNDTMMLYINGQKVSQNTVSTEDVKHNTSYLQTTIGAHFLNTSETFFPFNGNIDEVRIYNRALSASEIQELHCFDKNVGSVLPNLDIHMPSLNYYSLAGTQKIWVDLEYLGTTSTGQHSWGLTGFGPN